MSRGVAILMLVFLALGGAGAPPSSGRALPDYRYFRALSVDLVGRPPTRAEIAEFERPDFDVDRWIDAHLAGPSYAERLTRIYMDLLRLELPPTVYFRPGDVVLHWAHVLDDTGRPIYVYFRYGQRRVDPLTDGTFCFTQSESGIDVLEQSQTGTPKPIAKKLLDERTVLVKPWWLYADYRDSYPKDFYAPSWIERFGYQLEMRLFVEPDKSAMSEIRVCKEEAQTAETGHIMVTGRKPAGRGDPLPPGRTKRAPVDTPYAIANAGKSISCTSKTGFESAADCGCGVGLERCMPGAPAGFMTPMDAPLGTGQPFTAAPRPAHLWLLAWISQEAVHFMDRIFGEDRDVRELLTSRASVVNGPLAQFYRFWANATCCNGTDFGYAQAEPLFDPSAVPAGIKFQDINTWQPVADRGPHASGLMTMPVFLLKFGTRRQRAHAIYSAFMCKDFVVKDVTLQPSTEPDLTKRPGCRACHIKLEPMASYFSRIAENDWTYLPASAFPLDAARCHGDPNGRLPNGCKIFYDPSFIDASHAKLRGAYAAPEHVDAGPAGLAADVTASPEFAPCVVKNVAQSFLGRQLTSDDDTWKAELAKLFVDGGYKMRPLVRAIVTSPQYRDLNDRKPAP